MMIYLITTNVYLQIGITHLAMDNGFYVNVINPGDEIYTNKLNINSLVIFHVDRKDPSLLPRIMKLSRRLRVLLISSHNLKLEIICNASETIDERAPLEQILSAISSANGEIYHQKRETLLTVRERMVLLGILNGTQVNVMAKRLGLSAKTVYTHKLNAYKKLGAKNIHDIMSLKSVLLERDRHILYGESHNVVS